MSEPQAERDLLSQIPSPSKRLWAGLCVILSIFVVFAIYAIYQIRWLEDFQVNVVQQNRKASLQLLRLQNDAYLLAISIRDMAEPHSRYPIQDWQSELERLRNDMSNAAELENRYASSTPEGNDKRVQLRAALEDFWKTADQVFVLAQHRKVRPARKMIEGQLESRRAMITEIVARLLVINDRAQADAAERIAAVYSNVKRDIFLLIGMLFLLALGTGLYTFQANRKTFEKLHHLAERLQVQSGQLRKLSWKLIEIQEETLRHVARDLHDEFGQILTAIGVMLGRASQKGLEKNSPFVVEVEKVKRIVEDTLQNVRDSSQIFRPAILDDFGLEQTLHWMVQQFSRQTGIPVHLKQNVFDGLVDEEAGIHIYRIVQEALSNVARHSGARAAWVTLQDHGGKLRLEIKDNGRGFEMSGDMDRRAGEGIGLMGMRERAEHLNGSLEIHSAPGEGTVVAVSIPSSKPPKPAAAERTV
jgi:signal transduction histidine kinase